MPNKYIYELLLSLYNNCRKWNLTRMPYLRTINICFMIRLLKLPAVLFSICLLIVAGCGYESDDSEAGSSARDSAFTEDKEKKQIPEDIKSKEDKAMAVHDSIMPQMDSLRRLKAQLERRLKKSKSGAQAEELQSAIKDLGLANDKMMNWMGRWTKQYKRVADTLSIEMRRQKVDSLYEDARSLKKIWQSSLDKGAKLINQK